ncbi:hypothetical protein CEXT_777271 [Caerostris extrusa]|uniref:Uncharacterized protein n=1 Tax=Caerostris extrusa TaxID=172846 RepID=A0AAV4XDN7_CAEEX|nr:hypothetical protein CEXT_777271 [Caerostris extrusa]
MPGVIDKVMGKKKGVDLIVFLFSLWDGAAVFIIWDENLCFFPLPLGELSICARYRCIVPGRLPRGSPSRDVCRVILDKIPNSKEQYQLGSFPEGISGAGPGEGAREYPARIRGHHPALCARIPGQEEVQEHATGRRQVADVIQGLDRQAPVPSSKGHHHQNAGYYPNDTAEKGIR